MKKHLLAACAALCVLAVSTSRPQAQSDGNEAKRVRDSSMVFSEIMSASDKSIPATILAKASGIAIFPDTVKAGLVVGGTRGRGVLSARGPNGWSSPAFLTLTGGSF